MARPIRVEIVGDSTGFEKAMGDVEKTTSGLVGKLGKAGLAIGAAVVAGTGAAAVAAYNLGARFDEAYDRIITSSGATGQALEGLKQDFRNVVSDIPVDFNVAADALANLNTLTGATGDVLQDLTIQVSEASRMLGEDAVNNSAAFGRAMEQWQIPAEHGSDLMDGLFTITQKYGVSLGPLMTQLNKYGAIMQNAGFSIEETAVLMGRMHAAGLDWSRISPALNASMRNWADAGKDSREELGRVLVAMRDAETQTEALALASDVFGAQGAQRLTTAVRNGTFAIEDLASELDGSVGAIAANAEATDSFGEKWEVIKNKVFVALEPIAMRVFDAVSDFADWAIERFPEFQAKIEEWGQKVIEAFGWVQDRFEEWRPAIETVLSTVQSAVENLARAIAGAVSWIIEEWDKLKWAVAAAVAIMTPHFAALAAKAMITAVQKAAAWAMIGAQAVAAAVTHSVQVTAMVAKWIFLRVQSMAAAVQIAAAWLVAMGPIPIIIAAVVGLVALIVLKWDEITEFIGKAADKVGQIVSDLWNSIVEWFNKIRDRVSEIWSNLWNSVVRFFTQTVPKVVNEVSRMVSRVIEFIRGLPGRALSALGNLGRTLLSKGRDLIQGLWDGITELWNSVSSWFGGMPTRVRTAVGNLGGILVGAGRAILDGLWRGLRQKWDDVAGWVGGLGDRIRNLKGPIDVDRVLLVSEGQAIIEGLGRGMAQAWPGIERQLAGYSTTIGGFSPTASMSLTGPTPAAIRRPGSSPRADRVMAGSTNVEVNVKTDANAHDIAREIAWTLRTRR